MTDQSKEKEKSFVVEYITCSDAEIVKLHAQNKPLPKVSYSVVARK